MLSKVFTKEFEQFYQQDGISTLYNSTLTLTASSSCRLIALICNLHDNGVSCY